MNWKFWKKPNPPKREVVEKPKKSKMITMKYKEVKEIVLVTLVAEETGEPARFFIGLTKEEFNKLSDEARTTLMSSISLNRVYSSGEIGWPSGLVGYSGDLQHSERTRTVEEKANG